jgi:hypothetical protein
MKIKRKKKNYKERKKRGAYETEEALMMKRFRSRSTIKAIHRHSNLSVACRRHPRKRKREKNIRKEKIIIKMKKKKKKKKKESSACNSRELSSTERKPEAKEGPAAPSSWRRKKTSGASALRSTSSSLNVCVCLLLDSTSRREKRQSVCVCIDEIRREKRPKERERDTSSARLVK